MNTENASIYVQIYTYKHMSRYVCM